MSSKKLDDTEGTNEENSPIIEAAERPFRLNETISQHSTRSLKEQDNSMAEDAGALLQLHESPVLSE